MSNKGKSFGYYLKAKRSALGLSQSDLADKTNIQRTSISRLESHAGNPQWAMIRNIAEEGMGISVSEFFQVEPLESRQPVIFVDGQSPAPKLAELMLKTQGKPIPIVNSETPLRSKVVTDKDISGYCVIDHSILEEYKDRTIVAWPRHNTGTACSWLLADINDTVIKDGHLYLVDLNGVQARRAFLSPQGALILDAIEGDDPRPVAFWGRQKDRVEVLGRIIMTSRVYRSPIA